MNAVSGLAWAVSILAQMSPREGRLPTPSSSSLQSSRSASLSSLPAQIAQLCTQKLRVSDPHPGGLIFESERNVYVPGYFFPNIFPNMKKISNFVTKICVLFL